MVIVKVDPRCVVTARDLEAMVGIKFVLEYPGHLFTKIICFLVINEKAAVCWRPSTLPCGLPICGVYVASCWSPPLYPLTRADILIRPTSHTTARSVILSSPPRRLAFTETPVINTETYTSTTGTMYHSRRISAMSALEIWFT